MTEREGKEEEMREGGKEEEELTKVTQQELEGQVDSLTPTITTPTVPAIPTLSAMPNTHQPIP